MPELPEVEVTRLSFVERIAGAFVHEARSGKPLRWPLGCLPDSLVGKMVLTVRRRGKYLLIDFDRGLLILHLGMSGSLRFESQLAAPGSHDHFDLVTSHGTLRLHDPRRFGAVVYAESDLDPTATRLLGKLGVEPLFDEFELKAFQIALKRRRAPIKQVLLAGDVVVGVGNIYASEALFLAGIRPTTRASLLSGPRVKKLHHAIRDVLLQAVAAGGSTLRDFTSAQGKSGHFQLDAMVYGRTGQACRRCSTAIKIIRQGQRSSFYCPVCQKI
ncbi:MAG: bifunctional DNA-formamidopyrimidine glycosylase/DNA-(apurinic or apyrimidinic site) lyase [Rhodoferax sp.]|nr:bifunctional DNA-formamidopyrimidine glycosylase/DNA-(apurinic or apyrimidinic site) lyase [Rhodoferax sp.]